MGTDERPQLVADTTLAPFDDARVLAHVGNADGVIHATIAAPERTGR